MRTFETTLARVGLAVMASLTLATTGHAAAAASQKAFVQIEDAALGAGQPTPTVWLRIAGQPAGVDAACTSDGGAWFVAAGSQEDLQTIKFLATTSQTARFKLLVEYTVSDESSQYAGHGATRCKLSRLGD